jgi:HD-GYP domain-containing protein (c-di-GMP phosphodiesterase class II)
VSSDQEYDSIAIEAIPLTPMGATRLDLFVYFPYSKKYLRFIAAGDVFDDHRKGLLARHVDTSVYVRKSALEMLSSDPDAAAEVLNPKIEVPDEIHIFKEKVDAELKQIFRFLNDPAADASPKTLEAFEALSSQVIETVAPDVENLREILMSNSNYLMVMSDSAALTSISVLVAMAHGFNSRKIFRDLCVAVLLMDAGTSEFEVHEVDQFYKDPSALPPEVLQRFHQHPSKAAAATKNKMKNMTDPVIQLISGHHELYNGQGFPKKTRSENLPPLVRSLALSVDIFGVMKREKLRGFELPIEEAILELREAKIEPHLRRHNQRLLMSLMKFLSITDVPL